MIAFFCVIAFAFGMVSSAPGYCLALLAVLAGAYYIYAVCYSSFIRKDFDALLLQGFIFSVFLVYMLVKNSSASFYHALSDFSLVFSGLVGTLTGREISMGVTYSGFDLVCLFIIAFTVTWVFYRKKFLFLQISYFISIFMIWGVYIALWTILAENSILLGLGFIEPLTGPLDYRALLFAALLGEYTLMYKKLRREMGAYKSKVRIKECMGTAALAALCLALYFASSIDPKVPEPITGQRVLFWDSGIDFRTPEHGRYGLDNAGMFGFLPNYLETKGYSCAIVDTVDDKVLETADVLVVINPMSTPDNENLQSIWGFVERGGGLLAVGDHTGGEQIRMPLNAVLEPAGISFNFDSAIPFKTLWPDEFIMRRSPVFSGVSDRQIQAVVGASLETSYRAKPLLIGRCGYSDTGDSENAADGFLGNMQFERGERIGDLILAAESSYGKGKMIAFGDTSFLQNISIAYSYSLINNLFAYLAENSGGTNSSDSETKNARLHSPSCVIDARHMPSFSMDKSGNSVDGFIASALRAGMTAYVNQEASLSEIINETENLSLIVLLEPALALSEKERLSLYAFAENGGLVMIFGMYRSPEATKKLFAQFGFSFENIPIGRVSPDVAPEMAFWNACPLLYMGLPVADEETAADGLVEIWDYSVIARAAVGKGEVYAFGDADFIKNKNLESIDTYRKGNVDFISDLLNEAAGNRPEAVLSMEAWK
ncbi:MAG: hypothetical protein LBK69_07055 [Syntrophomonadaceae bacterium]|jgi:hypothetical protein|nr:hypothetical protein [Syntrophomonadaceae bacterium]